MNRRRVNTFINTVLSLLPAYHMRRLHGDMVTTTITSGLHRLPDYGASKVTAASEYKKRLFSLIYCSDKTHASLNGVPPLLNRVFCNIQPCLDLPDEAIFWPQDELASAVSKLDPDGWDPMAKSYHNTTVLRAKVQISSVREEVLEIALGVNFDCSESRIKCVTIPMLLLLCQWPCFRSQHKSHERRHVLTSKQ
jgi:hypothetical protein